MGRRRRPTVQVPAGWHDYALPWWLIATIIGLDVLALLAITVMWLLYGEAALY
jgi:hypothetical protein